MLKTQTTKKTVALAIFAALGLIASVVESLFPPLFVPGAKMGVSNIFTLSTLVIFGPTEACAVMLVRTLLGGLISNPSTLIYSTSAGLVSLAVEIVLYLLVFPRISLTAISVASAAIHNVTQNVIFCFVSGSLYTLSYAPYLALIGAVSGLIVGVATTLVIKKIPLGRFEKLLYVPSKEIHTEKNIESN